MVPRKFRTYGWDPIHIVSQIIGLQSLFYVSLSLLTLLVLLITGSEITLDTLIDWREFRGDNVLGWTLVFVGIINSLITIVYLVYLVSRAKLVLDFVLTLHFFHLCITSYYTGSLPGNFLWWVLQFGTAAVMVFGGEYMCMQREMEPILLDSGGTLSADSSNIIPGDPNKRKTSSAPSDDEPRASRNDQYELLPTRERREDF